MTLRRPALALFPFLAAVAALLGPGPSEATTTLYRIDVPDAADSVFEIPLRAQHPGPLVVSAEWEGPRILSFRLEGALGGSPRERRSGPSPQRIQVVVTDGLLAAGGEFKLTIRALAGKGAAQGKLTVEAPDAPEVIAERKRVEEPPPPPPPAPDPWTLAVTAPSSASPEVRRVYDAVERYRGLIVGADGQLDFDACAYRAELLKRLSSWRDTAAKGVATLSASSTRYVERLGAAVREVEGLRTATDPMLAGPPPSDPLRRKAWLQLRQERIRPLERELDALAEGLRGGHAPDLESETWPARLLACATACERYFERKGRGDEDGAASAELATAQWGSIVSAVDALAALAAVPGTRAVSAR